MERKVSYAKIDLQKGTGTDPESTFRPKINKKSQKMVRDSKIEEILLTDAKRRQ